MASITRILLIATAVFYGCTGAPYPRAWEKHMPEKSESLWKRDLGRALETSPVVRDQRVYVAVTDKKLMCLDLVSGKTRWSKKLDGAPVIGPALTENVVVVGTGYRKPQVHAFDAVSGKPLWKSPKRITSCVALGGDRALLGFDDGSLERVDARSGEAAWRHRFGNRWCSRALPAPDQKGMYVPVEPDSIIVLDVDSGEARFGCHALLNPFLLEIENQVVVLDGRGNLQIRRAEDLDVIRVFSLGGRPAGPPQCGGGIMVVALRRGTLAAYRVDNWKRQWSRTFSAPLTTGPALAGGNIYQALPRGEVVILDAASGVEIRRLQHPERLLATPAVSSHVLLVPGSHGTLAAYRLSGEPK